jgi:hypothetical protein
MNQWLTECEAIRVKYAPVGKELGEKVSDSAVWAVSAASASAMSRSTLVSNWASVVVTVLVSESDLLSGFGLACSAYSTHSLTPAASLTMSIFSL